MTGIKTVLRNSGYLLALRLLSRLFSVVFLLYSASKLGPELFGILSFTLVTVELINTLGDLGITRYGARELVRSWDKRAELFGKVLSLQVITSMFISLAGLFVITLINLPPIKFELMLLALLTFFLFSFIYATESVFIASQKFFFSALFTFIGRLAYMILGFVILANGGSVVLVMWGFLLSIVLEMILRMAMVVTRLTGYSFRFPLGELGLMLRRCVPFAVAGMGSIILYRGNVFVLEFIKGDQEVGIFSAAFSLFIPFIWIAVALNTTVFPNLTEIFTRDPDEARMSSWQWYRIMSLASIPMAMAVTLMAGRIQQFFPEGYEEIKLVLIILMWSVPAKLILSIDFNILQVINREAAAAKGIALGAAASLVFSFALIPFMGARGAALALLSAYIVVDIYVHLRVRKYFMKKNLLSLTVRPIVAGAVMGMVGLFALRINPWFAVSLSLVVYAIMVIALGAVRPTEIRSLFPRRAEV